MSRQWTDAELRSARRTPSPKDANTANNDPSAPENAPDTLDGGSHRPDQLRQGVVRTEGTPAYTQPDPPPVVPTPPAAKDG